MMNYLEEYDETDPISIETYAKRLIGKTFADVCKQDDITKTMVVRETANYEVKHENKRRKGGLGELIEERYFHYQTNNDASAPYSFSKFFYPFLILQIHCACARSDETFRR